MLVEANRVYFGACSGWMRGPGKDNPCFWRTANTLPVHTILAHWKGVWNLWKGIHGGFEEARVPHISVFNQ